MNRRPKARQKLMEKLLNWKISLIITLANDSHQYARGEVQLLSSHSEEASVLARTITTTISDPMKNPKKKYG